MAGRPKKEVPPSVLEVAIQKMEAKIAAAQAVVDMYESALSVLLEVSGPAPMAAPTPTAEAPKACRSHRRKADRVPDAQAPALPGSVASLDL